MNILMKPIPNLNDYIDIVKAIRQTIPSSFRGVPIRMQFQVTTQRTVCKYFYNQI